MWEVPKYRIRAYLRSVRSQRKRERDREQRQALHYRRVKVDLRLPDDFGAATRNMEARAVLNDLTARSLKVFTPAQIEVGTELALTIQAPKHFFVRARVIYCHETSYDTRIISDSPLRYRVGLAFAFHSPGEEMAVESFVEQVFGDHLQPVRDH